MNYLAILNAKTTKAFTLIELMIVVAIIGILAAIALPAYQDYTIRAQMAEGLTMTNALKPKISEFYKYKGRFPKDNAEAGLPEAKYLMGNYVKSMTVENGAIHIELGNKINSRLLGKILSLRPQYVEETDITPLAWLCGGSDVVDGMQVSGENKTDIRDAYLPMACR
jgi:type IV pilus assembly protein PilA